MKRFAVFAIVISLFLLSLFAVSCNITPEGYWSGDSNVNHRFTGLKKISDDDSEVAGWADESASKYQVLVLTDVHIGAGFYRFSAEKAFFSWLTDYPQKSQIKFAIGLGDFANAAKESEFKGYAEIVSKINAHGIKVLNVIGNHDLYADDGFELYEKYCTPGVSYYKFETATLVWYALDTASGTLGSRQLESLKRELLCESKMPVIFTHVPFAYEGKEVGIMPFSLRDTTERNILISLFSQAGILGYFCGHFHPGGTSTYGNVTQYNLKSFGEFGKWYILNVDETANPPVIDVTEFCE